DALTSGAAFVGIALALLAGPGWETSEEWAAPLASGAVGWNALRLMRESIDEIMDATRASDVERELRDIAATVPGVLDVEKSRVRKAGLSYLMDIHIEVEPTLSIREGHDIARDVKRTLIASHHSVADVVV